MVCGSTGPEIPQPSSSGSVASTNPAAGAAESEAGDAERKPRVTDTKQQSSALSHREWGGRDGPEPTRFGDWEKAGRCIDF
jgi:hypothetical protein